MAFALWHAPPRQQAADSPAPSIFTYFQLWKNYRAYPQVTAAMLDALSPGLRPELLRSLLTQLPLSGAVSASAVDHVLAVLDTHALLAEVVPDSAPAVDAFVERVLALSASQQARDCERSCSSGAMPQRAPDSRSVPCRTKAASQPPGSWP